MTDASYSPSNWRKPMGLMDRAARRVVARRLDGLHRGTVTLTEPSGANEFGESADLSATIRVNRSRFFRDTVLGGTMSVGESYLRGDWDCDDLTSLFRIFVRNSHATSRLDSGLARLAGWSHRFFHWLRANTRAGSRRNIEAHYDLGNEFFGLWLDETLAYSSGIFPTRGSSLREASQEKFDRVCRKLDLRPVDQVLEIGSGWGGFAIHAARHYGCQVTTTTISQEQFVVARERIAAAGLAGRVKLLNQDYRDLRGQYDKLVSIEMIEAVGYRHFDSYFRQCGQLLRPDGSFVLQAIVMPERGYHQYVRSVEFLQRYVFPGGCLPSLGAILDSVARTSDLRFVGAEDFAPHYAETLRRWRQAFQQRLADVRRLGYSETFIRLWNYYLCYCEAAFEERHIGLLQIQFDKPLCRRDAIPAGLAARGRVARVASPEVHAEWGADGPENIFEGVIR
jgi:cyclopropane-fatty-acyl-phospholipid synthase